MNKEKTYTIQEIANMLGVNYSTVRRWIYTNKIGTTGFNSKKEGYSIKESEINRFLDSLKPARRTKLASNISKQTTIASLGAAIGMLAVEVIGEINKTKTTAAKLLARDVKKHITEEIRGMRNAISEKEAYIKKLENEMKEMESKIKQYEFVLSNEELLQETVKRITEETKEKDE